MKKLIAVLLIVFVASLFGQTDSTNVRWNANPEPDIFEYRVDRSIDFGAFSQVISTPNISIVDRPPSPMQGHSYSYRVIAIDDAGNTSIPSDTVTVGIPDFIATSIPSTMTGQVTLSLNSVYTDPDNTQLELIKTFASQVNCAVSISATDIIITPANNFLGTGSFYSRVDDPDGWWDGQTVTFSIDTRDLTPPTAPTGVVVER